MLGRAGLTVLVAAACATGCGAAGSARSSSSTASASSVRSTATALAPTTRRAAVQRHRRRRHRPFDPGALPQTAQLPRAGGPAFRAEMRALWRAVLTGRPSTGLSAFFPLRAYEQVKALADPAGDWLDRLVGDFRLDVLAAHALLGSGARLLGVRVVGPYAHWVPPGACYNRVGYWEVPNARVVFREGAVVRSFGIASMISWRGVWYVIHLGAVLRPSAVGLVDDPSSGPGVAQPSSTC